KGAAALRHGLTPLLCIGESLEVKDAGGSAEFILEQASGALTGLTAKELARAVIAYEPIWAIGEKGRPATVSELIEPFAALGDVYRGAVTGLLYRGSVNRDYAADLPDIEHVTGLFVGRTAWQLKGYLELLRIAEAHAARCRARAALPVVPIGRAACRGSVGVLRAWLPWKATRRADVHMRTGGNT